MHGVKRGSLPAKDAAEQRRISQYNELIASIVEKRKQGDKSADMLDATARALESNPDNYTMWNYRKEILESQGTLLNKEDFRALCSKELKVVEAGIRAHPKSYWVWFQRIWVIDRMPEPDWKVELGLCNMMLDLDKRNFHCWDYRRYICKKIGRPDADEFKYTLTKINQQFSNYSAWHLRSELLPRIFPDSAERQKALAVEFKLVTDATFTSPEDQSAWLYQRWLIGKNFQPTRLLSGWKNGKFVSVAFSNAVLLTQLTDTYVVDDNGGAIQGSWSPSHGSVHHPSHVWTFTVGSSETAVKRVVFALEDIVVLFHEQKPVEKQMLAASISTPSPMSLVLDANQPTKDQSKLLLARTVNANKALLQATLVTVEELLAEEPDAKWPLLSSVLLMRDLVDPELDVKVSDRLSKLIALDGDRASYYNDLESKFAWEDLLSVLFSTAATTDGTLQLPTEVKVTGGLTSLWVPHYLPAVTKLDLSNNSLVSMQGAHVWVDLEELNLEGNKLVAIEDDIVALKHLKSLTLKGNPVCDQPSYPAFVWQALPQLLQLDGAGCPSQ